MSATADAGLPGRGTVRYFQEIEAHFSARFGAPLILSPRDVAKVEFWRSLGIPLAVVKRGIDRHFERMQPGRRRKAVVLSYCENDVLDAWEQQRAQGAGTKGSVPATGEDRAAALKKYLGRLRRAAGRTAGEDAWAGPLFESLVAAVEKSLSAKKTPGLEKLMLRVEKLLRREMRRLAPPETLEAMRAEAASELAPYRPRMEEAAYRETLDMQTLELLRRRLHVPAFPLD